MSALQFIREVLVDFFEYKTPKIVHIRSKKVGILNRIIQLIIILYIILYAIWWNKGYQQFSSIESSVTTKVKGVVSTLNISDDLFNPAIDESIRPYYKRIFDPADYVIPPSETGSFFVMTNVIISPNQTLGQCPESLDFGTCRNDTDCPVGEITGTGSKTGRCKNFKDKEKTCEINEVCTCEVNAWCPVEVDVPPLINNTALLLDTRRFTVLIKNTISFPLYNVSRRNILDTTNSSYLKNCTFNEETDKECPLFVLEYIVNEAGHSYEEMATSGGIIGILIDWTCNLDRDERKCLPKYSFKRLDNSDTPISPGWNFRFAQYYDPNTRSLYKAFGIKFVILVSGSGGRFNLIPLLITIGSGLGLLAVTTIVCDIFVLYLTSGKDYYKEKKYLYVNEVDEEVSPNGNGTQTNDGNITQTSSCFPRKNRKENSKSDEYNLIED